MKNSGSNENEGTWFVAWIIATVAIVFVYITIVYTVEEKETVNKYRQVYLNDRPCKHDRIDEMTTVVDCRKKR